MKLIVGLGNPGKKYEKTRHNVGFMAIDALEVHLNADEHFFSLGREKHKLYELSEWEYRSPIGQTERIALAKPQTFMNLSGEAVKFLATHAGKNFSVADDLCVIHDEVDVDFGRVKLDRDRSGAGHNGIQSIIDRLGSKNFIRLRIGVRPVSKEKGDAREFVLNRFSKKEQEALPGIFRILAEGCRLFFDEGFVVAQNRVNVRKTKSST